ncbi:uncharacterized protein UV8b_06258 [Ustilaginoidea virens]|uniref:ubiquitinyl hydrolase 1 n=1 Tax=Ustilaginoidea virens TaxID=1159556 RepID=A0A8E5HV04_USTVR|nr:uncharacterized protein UV8b_06258 [Ustilaginoidea virens]QUC22017.1 hypothetical protein UV8b_06258 [Ustilaginoidea virens]
MENSKEEIFNMLFEHLVLPPKLPGELSDVADLNKQLTTRLQGACKTVFDAEVGTTFDAISKSLDLANKMNGSLLKKEHLLEGLRLLGSESAAEWLIFHISEQNCGLLIHRNQIMDEVIFESFEASASAGSVLGTKQALCWNFPGRTVAVPLNELKAESFNDTLASFLEQANEFSFDQFAARALKKGKRVVETRDTPNPALISEMLMSLLEAVGRPVQVPSVQKRIRDDVVLSALHPWRRSPFWLILRVAVQRMLSNICEDGNDSARIHFKVIMCVVFAQFLKESSDVLHPEKVLMVRSKLCRRLAKLETERSIASAGLRPIYDRYITKLGDYFESTVEIVSKNIEVKWEDHRRKTKRFIPRLAKRVPVRDLVLTLPNSLEELQKLLHTKIDVSDSFSPGTQISKEGAVSKIDSLASHCLTLLDNAALAMSTIKPSSPSNKGQKISEAIANYIAAVGNTYHHEPQLMSQFLLNLFELWVALDVAATKSCPLLRTYHPVFVPEALDMLCLPTKSQMERLTTVQQYLVNRIKACKPNRGSIFSDPHESTSFATLYVQQDPDLTALCSKIDIASEKSRAEKKSELESLMNQYENLTREIDHMTCLCSFNKDGSRNVRGCTRCWKWRSRKNLTIGLHEDFLPDIKHNSHRAAIIFELGGPEYLMNYREATWSLIMMGRKDLEGSKPELLLSEYPPLRRFWKRSTTDSSLTLASKIKSFCRTHYKSVRLPKDLNEVIVSFGPQFRLYDAKAAAWVEDPSSPPWYHRLLGTWLPEKISDPFCHYSSYMKARENPSSYQIAANQTNYPATMSVHEFTAHQRAISGISRRWLVLVTELASTNLNFSSQDTVSLFDRLALQAGPPCRNRTGNILREVHLVFQDVDFCEKLHEQLHLRQSALASGCREINCMSILVTLCLRLFYLCPGEFRERAVALLRKSRRMISDWIIQLRDERMSTDDSNLVGRLTSLGLQASLLCRQTFEIYSEEVDVVFGDEEASIFFRASIALSENLVDDLDKLSPGLQRLMVRDLSTVGSMRETIKNWTREHCSAFEGVINEAWNNTGGPLGSRCFSEWQLLPDTFWFMARTTATKLAASQTVHYHAIQGHLLIEGKPLGRLPLQMREDASIRELFPGQYLFTRSSSLRGMEYQLATQFEHHDIHFGHREGKVIIRAESGGCLFEHVPRTIFGQGSSLDLPSGLIDDCVHWLNLNTGTVEICRKPDIWKSKRGNWILDIQTRRATRNQGKGNKNGANGRVKHGTCLVDPNSSAAKNIIEIFRNFETPGNLTIYQSLAPNGVLYVEIKRLELRFEVNNNGRLHSRQLLSEIDPVQDVGALYGLESMLVLRKTSNRRSRSIIIPTGAFSWMKKGMHVSVRIKNEGAYVRFFVDDVLGRLVCAPEPWLLYLKALIHASTSFPLPDRLTGRNGTEEAHHCLVSANCQPWTVLNDAAKGLLSRIASLSPERSFYPSDKRVCQKVIWDDNLTATIQHEQLANLANSILQQSHLLESFDTAGDAKTSAFSGNMAAESLTVPGTIRRQIYERAKCPSDVALVRDPLNDTIYPSRDRGSESEGSCRVYKVVRNLLKKVDKPPKLADLGPIMEAWQNIAGFDNLSMALDIHKLLTAELPTIWGPFVGLLRLSDAPNDDYNIRFRLALLAFGKNCKADIIDWLVAMAQYKAVRDVEPPQHDTFTGFRHFQKPEKLRLREMIKENQKRDISLLAGTRNNKKSGSTRSLDRDRYETLLSRDADCLADALIAQWPNLLESSSDLEELCKDLVLVYIDADTSWTRLGPELERLACNLSLSNYLSSLEQAVDCLQKGFGKEQASLREPKCHTNSDNPMPCLAPETFSTTRSSYQAKSLSGDLISTNLDMGKYMTPGQETGTARLTKPARVARRDSLECLEKSDALSRLPEQFSILYSIIKPLLSHEDISRRQYGEDLESSLKALIGCRTSPELNVAPSVTGDGGHEIAAAKQALDECLDLIRTSCHSRDITYRWLSLAGMWPCVGLVDMLEQLRKDQETHLGSGMKEALVQCGVLVTRLQRLIRLEDATLRRDGNRIAEEKSNEGHTNWSPLQYPEWLLFEIDSGILIRPVQVDVAKAIIAPTSKKNSVLQMNMGQGKTSCVTPMAAILLADKNKLCRLMVPKPLLLQTAQVMQARIGGLVGRKVCHIPFARRSPCSAEVLDQFWSLHKTAQGNGDIMLCVPTHILSFKLSGLQRLADEKMPTGKLMVEIQKWLDRSCRDILDESDLTLSVQTQLIYPSGPMNLVDGHPYRWYVVEEVLSLVEKHIAGLQDSFQGKVEVDRRHEGFPTIYFLDAESENALNDLLLSEICRGALPQLQFTEPSSSAAREDVRDIIAGCQVSVDVWERATKSLVDDNLGPGILYLLRGLISERIVLLCLKKRWNVQYGLHPERPPIAVPYEAKGVPSETAEYGHPETALLLTCLAFYQTGLSRTQIKQSLESVIQSDDPAAQYDRWVCGCDQLPPSLQYWNLIDPDNETQVKELWGLLRYDRTAVNHYMNTFVFPVHAKQFSVKLQASGWDIPLVAVDGSISDGSLTTGFSGTNDNKRMLPKTIEQDDLPELIGTNAEVLCHLLEARNRNCHHAVNEKSSRLTEIETLELLQKKEIRILIDAGAHILEMENSDVAEAWLKIEHAAEGAVYFGSDNQVMVRSRFKKGAIPLVASSFVGNLEKCVVYFDEGHTRGTDLQLPTNARGAVTLGLGQTKDHTVQAAMRLRKLGSTQSVAFIATPEVHQSILDVRKSQTGTLPESATAGKPPTVTSIDVVRWLLDQSCKANEQMMSLYRSQCQDFCRRTNSWWKHPKYHVDRRDLKNVLQVIMQKESQTLEQLYGPRGTDSQLSAAQLDYPQLQAYVSDLPEVTRAKTFSASALMEVEQEREVVFEVEQVREQQPRQQYEPLLFPRLHPAISEFAKSGSLDAAKVSTIGPLIQAFDYVGKTKLGRKYRVRATASSLFVSEEFSRTVVPDRSRVERDILRPVEWVLWSPSAGAALVIIPEEADLLIPLLREVERPKTWLLSYAAPVTKAMLALNKLTYLTVPGWPRDGKLPGWLAIELGVLSGRLYFEYAEYKNILAWLGLSDEAEAEAEVEAEAGSEAGPGPWSRPSAGLPIKKPLKFLQEWVSLKRQTQDISYTPVGFLCQRKELHADHFFFTSAERHEHDASAARRAGGGIQRGRDAESEDDEDEDEDEDEDGDEVEDEDGDGDEVEDEDGDGDEVEDEDENGNGNEIESEDDLYDR